MVKCNTHGRLKGERSSSAGYLKNKEEEKQKKCLLVSGRTTQQLHYQVN